MREMPAGTTRARAGLMLSPVLAGLLAALLAACGPQSPEAVRAASLAKCERQFGRMAPDPAKGAALCGCLVDRLAGEGLEITDMLGGDRGKVEGIMRQCAGSAGVDLPQ
jgi:hypothetical protein